MPVPSRAFVGILVFALIATLAVVPYTLLVLSGYQPPPETPYDALFPEPDDSSPGTRLVLVLASLFCVALVVSAWRGLLHGARLDRKVRAERAARPPQPTRAAGAPAPKVPPAVEDEPPGYQ
ncbi:MAG: hypothetical protein AABY18_03470 [Candidatus Thermoplasmatota archaeon]|mgnify:CR=1 FL=1